MKHNNNSYKVIIGKLVMEDEIKKIKMAIISGASHAIRYKEENPRASESEVIQHVSNKAGEILGKLDEEL